MSRFFTEKFAGNLLLVAVLVLLAGIIGANYVGVDTVQGKDIVVLSLRIVVYVSLLFLISLGGFIFRKMRVIEQRSAVIQQAGFDPDVVASDLTSGQENVMRSLTASACLLGCSEDTARRLAIGNKRRPALTYFIVDTDTGNKLFGLTPFGLIVQEYV